jgi:hypothetical protein
LTERRPRLVSLRVADPPERWAALGFEVGGERVELGGIRVQLGGSGSGITSWAVAEIDPGAIDGLATEPPARTGPAARHPNGALGIDHVVVVTPSFERTRDALAARGMALRRETGEPGTRMGFRRLGPAILELVEAREAPAARFWGLTVVVEDLEALAERLGEQLGTIRAAVQPGRRIATLRESAGLSTNLAFMDPAPAN